LKKLTDALILAEMEDVITQEDLRPVLGTNVARLRGDKKMTQVQLAARVGISEQHLNRIETGKASVSDVVLYSLADALGVPTDKLRELPLDAG